MGLGIRSTTDMEIQRPNNSPPANLGATYGNGQATVDFSAVAPEAYISDSAYGLVKYEYSLDGVLLQAYATQPSTTPSGPYIVTSTLSTSGTVHGLTNGTVYTLKVRGYYSDGDRVLYTGHSSVQLSPTAAPTAPTITVSPASLTGFETPTGTASTSQSLTVNGTALTANITLTAPSGFQISSDNSTFSSSLSLTRTGGNVTAAIVYARIASTASVGSVSGNITLASAGADNQTVALSGTVSSLANSVISVSTASLGNFTAKLGSASSATAFLVGGSDLTANLTISAPTGFEISSTGSAPFASSLDLAPASGTVASTSVYARLAATAAAGVNSGNITLASTGATSQQVAVSGTVTLPYEDWVAYWNTQTGSFSGATALGSADPDGDGLSNTTEFAFQGDPLSPTASLISVAPAGGNITVTFLARVGNGTIWTGGNATGHGLDYQIQSTGNLTLAFDPANDVSNLTPTTDQTGIQPADFPYVRWEFQAPISGDKKFYRVRALPQGDQ